MRGSVRFSIRSAICLLLSLLLALSLINLFSYNLAYATGGDEVRTEVVIDESGIVLWPTEPQLPRPGEDYIKDEMLIFFARDISVEDALFTISELTLVEGLRQTAWEITREDIAKQMPYVLNLKPDANMEDAILEAFTHPLIDWAGTNALFRLVDEARQTEDFLADQISPDALCAASLSGVYNAPILITSKTLIAPLPEKPEMK